ncbi:MAG: hypothetical protein RSC76_09950 [Oscillospiraceae bacterium]
MQYCTKCKNLVEDKIAVCPHCKRTKSLRQAKAGDSVFLMKTTEFEAGEIAAAFEQMAIKFEVRPFTMGHVSSLYDSEVMPTDKNMYVNYEDIDSAKKIIEEQYAEESEEDGPPEDTVPQGKRIAVQIASVIAFLVIVSLVVFGTDAIANGIKDFFGGLKI